MQGLLKCSVHFYQDYTFLAKFTSLGSPLNTGEGDCSRAGRDLTTSVTFLGWSEPHHSIASVPITLKPKSYWNAWDRLLNPSWLLPSVTFLTVRVINSRLDWSWSHQLYSNISTYFSWITEDLQGDNRKEEPYSSIVCRLKHRNHQKDGCSHVFCIHPRSCGFLTSVGTASSLRV